MPRQAYYPHQKFMAEESIKISDLPQDIQSDLNDFEGLDREVPGYNISLEDESKALMAEIEEWLDEETDDKVNCPCKNKNLGVLVMFYIGEGVDIVSKKDLIQAGFDRKKLETPLGMNKRQVDVSDDFRLERDGKKKEYKIINQADEQEKAAA